jgi:hypothetical protein
MIARAYCCVIGVLGHRFDSRFPTSEPVAQIANDARSISGAMRNGRSAAQIAQRKKNRQLQKKMLQ